MCLSCRGTDTFCCYRGKQSRAGVKSTGGCGLCLVNGLGLFGSLSGSQEVELETGGEKVETVVTALPPGAFLTASSVKTRD